MMNAEKTAQVLTEARKRYDASASAKEKAPEVPALRCGSLVYVIENRKVIELTAYRFFDGVVYCVRRSGVRTSVKRSRLWLTLEDATAALAARKGKMKNGGI